MKKIIKHGNTYKRIECKHCKCIFEFSIIDVHSEYSGQFVNCPECNESNQLSSAENVNSEI